MSEWIEWKGGKCPVPPDVLVEYKLDNPPLKCGPTIAADLDWKHGSPYIDIIAYRIVDGES